MQGKEPLGSARTSRGAGRARKACGRLGRFRHPRETRLELVERIGEAYGLVLLLILVTFAVMMTLPPEGWGGRVAAVAVAGLTAVIGLTSSDVRAARVRLAVVIAVAAVAAALIGQAVSSIDWSGSPSAPTRSSWQSPP